MVSNSCIVVFSSQVLGASIANAYPLDFAQPHTTWLNRQSMLAQQELIMPVGNGLGMLLGRVFLGSNPHLYMRFLGLAFFALMFVQAVIVAIGWDPERTQRLYDRFRGRVEDTSSSNAAARPAQA